MNSTISPGRFLAEAEPYKHFLLTYEDPLTPLSFSILFDRIAVCLSASPYIAFINSDAKFCLSHIETIKRYVNTDKEKVFSFVCNNFSALGAPTPVKVSLKCY